MNADRLAPWYLWIERLAFGHALERRRCAFLNRLAAARRVLLLGEGDGRCLKRLLEVAPHAQIDVVEASSRMIAIARKRIGDTPRVRFIQANALTATEWSADRYDGVTSHFFLDCFSENEARNLIGRVITALDRESPWLISEFSIPAKGWQRFHALIWIRAMYLFFRMATGLRTQTLPPYARLLEEAGMLMADAEEERWGLIRSEVWIKKEF